MTMNKIQKSYTRLFSNKLFRSLLKVSATNHVFLKTFDSQLPYIEVWFTDQNSQPLEVEDLSLVIK